MVGVQYVDDVAQFLDSSQSRVVSSITLCLIIHYQATSALIEVTDARSNARLQYGRGCDYAIVARRFDDGSEWAVGVGAGRGRSGTDSGVKVGE